MAECRRVVITGVGLVTPLGVDTASVWDRLVKGESGISAISRFDVSDLDCKIGGQVVSKGEADDYMFDPEVWVDGKDVKKVDNFILFGVAAADMALKDAGILDSNYDPSRIGVLVGSGIGGLPFIEKNITTLVERGPRRVSPFFIPGSLVNLLPGHISIKYGFTGYCNSVVSACATGAIAIAEAARAIKIGDCDVVVAGGAEAAISRAGLVGFGVIKALSTKYNDTPSVASRPWDSGRDGFVMGEGAGVMVLEDYEYAKRRGARILAELSGYGLTSDAHHITAPHPQGVGGAHAMELALKAAGITCSDIGYINAHGTSTPVGDSVEIAAVKSVFQDHAKKLAISSTKSSIGHLLGAAGGVEAIFSVLALRSGAIPPTLNLHDSTEDSDLNLVPLVAQERSVSHVLSNSFGFGGVNASLIFSRI
ncbi:beta-ketoacyl-ACP synthase II [Candidatus Anaplasma sp. TIGMIC]|uniref:beta-ketoacyl-ACP synthase II n=1 Tax=Candidatus Anaplasma sp. TIGMIC TaxID=3020713 RepID=UPI002330E778|nr:beta-ketoacyl-ACP synthase II [Candidatus Anaplasma sp. TIGMIC]MDB1135058.1 beta-ketoacyl-ACP synthase II [Candidatus Anaplasma sp. TIGMIC]